MISDAYNFVDPTCMKRKRHCHCEYCEAIGNCSYCEEIILPRGWAFLDLMRHITGNQNYLGEPMPTERVEPDDEEFNFAIDALRVVIS